MIPEDQLNISNDMRKRAFAMMDEMADGLGYDTLSLYAHAKRIFTEVMDLDQTFSLSIKKCSVQDYRRFMRWLLHVYFEFGCDSDFPIYELFVDDLESYMVSCIKHRRCAISGRMEAVHIHHVNRIGMGRNRYHTDHSRYLRMALRADYHWECHTIGQKAFDEKYGLVGVYCQYWNNSNDKIDEAHGELTEELRAEIEQFRKVS